jgi:apolipoprotein N-acyltransferase
MDCRLQIADCRLKEAPADAAAESSQAAPAPSAICNRRSAILWLCPLASAALLYLAYFPVAWGWLAWFALVPLLVLVRQPGAPRHLYLACWVGGLAFHWPVLQWVRVADLMMYAAWAALATYGALYWPVALALVRAFERRTRLPLVVTFPAVWVALEFVRYGLAGCFVSMLTGSHQHDVPGGFGWYILGHTQHDFLELIQVADLGGAYALTFLVAAANALLFEALAGRGWFRRVFLAGAELRWRRHALLVQGLGVVLLLFAALGYGKWRLAEPLTTRPGPRIALMQTNIDQRFRNLTVSPDPEKREKALDKMIKEFAGLAGQAGGLRPDLVITPETSYPGTWQEWAPGQPRERSQKLARDVTAAVRAPVLLGMTAVVLPPDGKALAYNSAILVGRDGRWLGRYDKMHRVPFGEYIPLGTWLPFLSALSPYEGTSWVVHSGTEFTRFPLLARGRGYTFGVLICYEDTDPALARPYGGGGQEPVDFLVNISNDGWFNGTSEHDQHLAICRFRAVECRRSVARSVNMGISAVIDSNGRVLAPELVRQAPFCRWEIPEGAGALPVSRWHEFKKVSGVLVATVPLDDRVSFYARQGDLFAAACLAAVLVLAVALRITRRRQPA